MKRYDCTLSDKRGAFGDCMEAHSTGRYVLFSDVEKLQRRMQDLLDKSNSTGVAIERAISTGSVLADHPLKSRLELLANHHKREQALERLLREVLFLECRDGLRERIEAALAGKLQGAYELPEMNPDWSKAPAWAKFWAVDFDGMANWFSHEPKESMCRWCYPRRRGAQHKFANQFVIDVKKIKKTHLDFWWRDTLAAAPKPEGAA